MKEVPESLKLEFTMAMREFESEVQKQKQEKETFQQAIKEGLSKKKTWHFDLNVLWSLAHYILERGA